MVQKLVKKGAKVDERRGDGTTPLMVHAEQGNKEVVRELIRQSANVDLQDEVSRVKNAGVKTPLETFFYT